MKIVVLDGATLNPGDLSWKMLQQLGSCRIFDRTSATETLARIGDAEIILTNKVVIGKILLNKPPILNTSGCWLPDIM